VRRGRSVPLNLRTRIRQAQRYLSVADRLDQAGPSRGTEPDKLRQEIRLAWHLHNALLQAPGSLRSAADAVNATTFVSGLLGASLGVPAMFFALPYFSAVATAVGVLGWAVGGIGIDLGMRLAAEERRRSRYVLLLAERLEYLQTR